MSNLTDFIQAKNALRRQVENELQDKPVLSFLFKYRSRIRKTLFILAIILFFVTATIAPYESVKTYRVGTLYRSNYVRTKLKPKDQWPAYFTYWINGMIIVFCSALFVSYPLRSIGNYRNRLKELARKYNRSDTSTAQVRYTTNDPIADAVLFDTAGTFIGMALQFLFELITP